jgi:hypothetical protein
MLVAAAGWMNFPNRVPVLANAHERISMPNDSRALKMISKALERMKSRVSRHVIPIEPGSRFIEADATF